MNRVPTIISVGLVVAAVTASVYISSIGGLTLSDSEQVNAYIALSACLGALVSATFVVFSYLETNKAYVEAQRPHLLIQMASLKAKEDQTSETLIPMSSIHYRNISNNRFLDLTILVRVSARNRSFSLSDLFREKMTMIGQDTRQRTFNPTTELRSRGLELQQVATEGNEIQLTIDYKYTFNGIEDYVNAQVYRWDAKREEWTIC